ncbi:unnamed protein product [Ectocarpus sp. CCAP 1310/34]|nr:unnamed protein product [Ectocarpus sp. CCAP 1310/34]
MDGGAGYAYEALGTNRKRRELGINTRNLKDGGSRLLGGGGGERHEGGLSSDVEAGAEAAPPTGGAVGMDKEETPEDEGAKETPAEQGDRKHLRKREERFGFPPRRMDRSHGILWGRRTAKGATIRSTA